MVDSSRTGRRRVWVGVSEDQDTSVNLTPKFVTFGNVLDDVQDVYSATDGVVETTLWDGNLPRVDKRLESIEIETRNLGVGGRQIKVEYQINQEGEWYRLPGGTANESPFVNLKFPTGTAAKVLQLRLTLQMTAVDTTSPELLSFRVRAQLRPDPSPIYSVKIYVADQLMLLNGATTSTRSGDLKQLRTWNEGAAEVLLTLPEDDDFV